MVSQFIIIDSTNMHDNNVCTAMVDTKNPALCIRPIDDYYTTQEVDSLKLHVGNIISLSNIQNKNFMKSKPPHIEDYAKNGCSLQYIRQASIQEFKNVLESTLYNTIETGFGVSHLDDKVIKVEQNPIRSLITLRVKPNNIKVFKDEYKKIRLSFYNNKNLSKLPINDRRISPQYLQTLNDKIKNAETIYLRLGLTRIFEDPSTPRRKGYWVQVNGIYPDGNYAI